MKWLIRLSLLAALLATPAWAQDAEKAGKKDDDATTAKKDDAAATAVVDEVQQCYDKLVDDYMNAKWKAFDEDLKDSRRLHYKMTRDQRDDVTYMTKAAKSYRPSWWHNCRSASNVSFRAVLWGKRIMANYMPSQGIGEMMPVDIHNGKIRVIVTWKPNLVDNPRAAEGELAKLHNITKGDLGEAIVWHELGHNFITSRLSARTVLKLYEDHGMLYMHLQEFYADMAAVYHCSPKARLCALLIRADSLDWYQEDEAHTRAGHAIGALLLSHMMTEPDKWPSIHFPSKVPQQDAERKVILYVYDHIDAGWTLGEDRQLRELVGDFIRKHGNDVFRRRGTVRLANGLDFHLMATDDREDQPKRDAWVSKRLEELIKSGRADKTGEATGATDASGWRVWTKAGRIELPW